MTEYDFEFVSQRNIKRLRDENNRLRRTLSWLIKHEIVDRYNDQMMILRRGRNVILIPMPSWVIKTFEEVGGGETLSTGTPARTHHVDWISYDPYGYDTGDPQRVFNAPSSPEMQAIRAFLLWFSHRHGDEQDMRDVLLNEAKLPSSVVDWVMEGQWQR